jgi:transcriptional regulator with XRE-family HTH domain
MSMSFSPSRPAFNPDTLCRKVWGMLFGQEIQALREKKRLSLDQAAARAGMTAAEWEAIEAGRVPRNWEQVCAVAAGLSKRRLELVSLVVRYSGAWGDDFPREISQQYS